uniref:Uncharacterized protein n=1 Tax=Tanacetum cinerariifolium TaxID=118510 RepID=A0A6L2N7Q2_TANCI|nr:hypothetical protein [Tanacetum cinerariifolium]
MKQSHPLNLFNLTPPHKTHCHLGNLETPHWAEQHDKEARVGIDLIGGQGKWRVKMKVLSSLTTEAQLAHYHFVFEDRIICDLNKTLDLFQEPPHNCPKCGNPVDDFQDTSEPSNDNTNVVNAPQEPFVFKQDPGENSSQSPPHINHHCCYGCADSLEDIFCHQCTCEFCGKGAHYGYNCPPKVSVVSNSEPCHNQNFDELPQTLISFHPTCYSENEDSFTYDSKYNIVDDSPNVFYPPSQPSTYSYEFCGNNAYYGHDCPVQVLFTYDPKPCNNQDFNFP